MIYKQGNSLIKSLILFFALFFLFFHFQTAEAYKGQTCTSADNVGRYRFSIENRLPDVIKTQVLDSSSVSHDVRTDFGYAGDGTYQTWQANSTVNLCYDAHVDFYQPSFQMLIQNITTGLVGVVGINWFEINLNGCELHPPFDRHAIKYASLNTGIYMNSFANVGQAGGYGIFDCQRNTFGYGVFNTSLPISSASGNNVSQKGSITVTKIRDAVPANNITALYRVTNHLGTYTNRNLINNSELNILYVANFNPLKLFYNAKKQANFLGLLLPASGVTYSNGNYSLTDSEWYLESPDNTIDSVSFWSAMNDDNTYKYNDNPQSSVPAYGPKPINTNGNGIAATVFVNLVNISNEQTLNVYANGLAQSPVQVILTKGASLANGGKIIAKTDPTYGSLYNNIIFKNVTAGNQVITNTYSPTQNGGYLATSTVPGPYVLTDFSTQNSTALVSSPRKISKKVKTLTSNGNIYYLSGTMTGSAVVIQACVENNTIFGNGPDEACSNTTGGTSLGALNLVEPYALTATGNVNNVKLSNNGNTINIDDPNSNINRTCTVNNCIPSTIVATNTSFPRIIGLTAYLSAPVNATYNYASDNLGKTTVSNGALIVPKYDSNPPIAFNTIDIYGDVHSEIAFPSSSVSLKKYKKLKN